MNSDIINIIILHCFMKTHFLGFFCRVKSCLHWFIVKIIPINNIRVFPAFFLLRINYIMSPEVPFKSPEMFIINWLHLNINFVELRIHYRIHSDVMFVIIPKIILFLKYLSNSRADGFIPELFTKFSLLLIFLHLIFFHFCKTNFLLMNFFSSIASTLISPKTLSKVENYRTEFIYGVSPLDEFQPTSQSFSFITAV